MDFLETTMRRNPGLIKAAFEFYATGLIHQDTYVLDLDAVRLNSASISRAAKEAGLKTYFEAKQFGRNPLACQEVVNSGMREAIAIDLEEAKSLHRSGFKVGHVGHLGQVPRTEARYVVGTVSPEVITVYNVDKAAQISKAAKQERKKQKLLLKVIGDADLAYNTLGGGVAERDVISAARRIKSMSNVTVAGVTTYPSMRYNLATRRVEPTPNFDTLIRCATKLRDSGFEVEQVNAAGLSSTSTMKLLAEAGATHAEPGQAIVGMTPLHGFSDEPEIPGMVYITEVDHTLGSRAFAYGSGFVANITTGIWNPLTYEYLYALAGNSLKELLRQKVILEPPVFPGSDPSFFMYLTLRRTPGTTLKVGQTVIAGCRGQVYRANSVKVAVIDGIQKGKPKLRGIYDRNGIRLEGPSDTPVV
ncbi:MAG: alanine racemase [Thaumarchaeota archaeon]|nr:alanine racemase [Nitrososphaerota archaeon]